MTTQAIRYSESCKASVQRTPGLNIDQTPSQTVPNIVSYKQSVLNFLSCDLEQVLNLINNHSLVNYMQQSGT